MHDNNVTPFGMMKASPLTPEKCARFPYLYNATRNAPRHQCGGRMPELLEAARDVTLQDAIILSEEFIRSSWKSCSTNPSSSNWTRN